MLAEADRLIENWLAYAEGFRDDLLNSCTSADLRQAFRRAVRRSEGCARDPRRGMARRPEVTAGAARSLWERLGAVSAPDAAVALCSATPYTMLDTDAHGSGSGGAGADSPTPASILAGAAARIHAAGSPGAIKRAAVQAAVHLCRGRAAVWWDVHDGRVLTAAAQRGIRLSGPARQVALSKSLWRSAGASDDAVRLSSGNSIHAGLLGAAGARDGLAVRAVSGGRTLGAIAVYDGDFDAERTHLLAALAHHAAAACQAVQLGADKRHLAEIQQRTVSELGFALSSALSLDELLDLVCRSVLGLVSADACVLCLADPDGRVQVRAASAPEVLDWAVASEALVEVVNEVRAQPLGRPLTRSASASQPLSRDLRDGGYRNLLGVALTIRSEPLGALIVLGRDASIFAPIWRETLLSFAAQAAIAIENLHLVEDMQRRLLEMADLTWVSTRISSTMDVERIAATVVDATAKALDVPRVALLTVDDSGGYAPVPGGQRGAPSGDRPPLPGEGHLGHEAVQLGVPQMVSDAVAEGREDDALLRWLEVRSLLCVPMVTQQGLLGILAIGDERPRGFPAHAVALLSAYANQTALAMQSAMLYQDAVRHLKQLGDLVELSQTLASSLDLTKTLDRVLRAGAELLDAPVGSLMLMDPAASELVIKASRGLRPDDEFQLPLKMGEGLAGKAAQSGRALTSDDITRDGRFARRGRAREGGLHAAIASPLIARGRTVGVLNLYRRSAQPFGEDDIQLAMALANSAAVAIENARLYEETEERAQFLTAMVSEINHRVRNTLQAVAGLLRMEITQRPQRPIEEVLRRGIARLQSVAVVHDMLQARDLRFVDIKQAASRIVQITSQTAAPDGKIETRVSGVRVMLPSQQAANIAMVLSELVDNATKHGVARTPGGRITVNLAESGNSVVIEVTDNGAGLPDGFDSERDAGMGLKVVRALVEEELGGAVTLESDKGLTVRAKFPKHR